eukprot:4392358-Alexandrium_andersonii.AAC.1
MLATSVQLDAPAVPLWPSRPAGKGGPPPQRLIGAPSKPPPSGRQSRGECVFTQQLGAPPSRGPSRF